jgi:short-subunit dehydrogenase
MNKLVVVTGGTKGIGRAVLARFAREGCDLVTCARNQADLDQLEAEFSKMYPGKIFTYAADLSDKRQAVAFAGFIQDLKRPVDVLVNNAGFFSPGNVTEDADGSLESMIEGNVYSAYYLTRGLVKVMKEKRSGYIFNMCSIASFKAYPNGGSYTISKFALLGFSKVLREELKEFGIRVTAVMPGATRTASWDGTDLPEDRFMKADDVAETIYSAYSLSPNSVVEEIIIRPQLGDL